MSDLALTWNPSRGSADFSLVNDDIATDDGLETAVLLSLFTGGPSGWWGDALAEPAGDVFGGKLHLLAREKDTPSVLEQAQTYASEALAWLIADAVAASVTVTAESLPHAPGQSILALTVTISRPNVAPAVYRYAYNWQSQELRLGL